MDSGSDSDSDAEDQLSSEDEFVIPTSGTDSDSDSDQQPSSEEVVTPTKEGAASSDTSKAQVKSSLHSSTQNIKVKTSSNKEHQRIYDKKHYCLFCEKPYAKITRHLKQKHQNEPDVAKALAHRPGSKLRSLLLTKTRNMGNYQHNCFVISSGEGEIVPKRQATHESSATDYLPCRFCFAMYVKTELWRHHRRCHLKEKEDGPLNRKVQSSSSLILPTDIAISRGVKDVIGRMVYDRVTQIVSADPLIISLGERMFSKNGEVVRHHSDIRNKMREMARLVMEARKVDKDIVHLQDLIDPSKFDTVLQAVKTMTGFDELNNRFTIPSTALKLRHSLVKVTGILQGEAIRQGDNALKDRVERFDRLIQLEWTTHVSSNALKTLYQKKWNQPQMLPFTEDIKTLHGHLKTLEAANKKSLQASPARRAWNDLSQITLAQLILFNRRRSGEVSRMEMSTYLHRNNAPMQDEILKTLSPFEKKLCETFVRLEVRGKRGRKVPILLPPNVMDSIELLIATRKEVGISSGNPYIFARVYGGSEGNIRGCDSLRRFAGSCGAKHPEHLTSTKLRKHIATLSQVLNLKGNELDQLATFMGHDIRVHRSYYRLPEDTLQVAKVSRLLLALESGLSTFKGKSLEDITPDIDCK